MARSADEVAGAPARVAGAADDAAEETVTLYHGSRGGLVGDKFSLDEAARGQTATHLTGGAPAVYLTDDFQRAATQYATPRGTVSRTVVPRSVADTLKQTDKYGRTEFKASTAGQLAPLNEGLETLPQRSAILRWWLGS